MNCKVRYIELPLTEYVKLNPGILEYIPISILSDHNYIVRFVPGGQIELGYRSDEWTLSE